MGQERGTPVTILTGKEQVDRGRSRGERGPRRGLRARTSEKKTRLLTLVVTLLTSSRAIFSCASFTWRRKLDGRTDHAFKRPWPLTRVQTWSLMLIATLVGTLGNLDVLQAFFLLAV